MRQSSIVPLSALYYYYRIPLAYRQLSEKGDAVMVDVGRSMIPAGMSLEEKIGRLIWCGFKGYRSAYNSAGFTSQRRMLEQGLLGGLVLQEGDLYESATLINQIQQGCGRTLVVAADAENGLGALLNEGTCFPSNMAFGATRSGEYGYLAGKVLAEEATAVGINLIFGPTCARPGPGLPEGLPDVRAFGEKLHLVTRLSIAFVRGVHDGGARAVPRYFPGTAAVLKGEIAGNRWLHYMRKLLVDTELSIYEMLFQAGLGAVMVDWREMPDLLSGRSRLALTNYQLLEVFLREVMGFEGVAVSPDLSLPGMEKLLEPDTLAGMINAGVDVLAGVPNPEEAMRVIREAVVLEKISLSRLDSAVERALGFSIKVKSGEKSAIRPEEIDKRVGSPANLEVADRIAEDSITLLRDRRGVLPLDPASHRTLLNISFTSRAGNRIDGPLEGALREKFDRVIARRIDRSSMPSSLDEAWEETGFANVIVCSMFTNQPPDYTCHGFSTSQIEFIQRLISREQPVIMVAFGDPCTIRLFPEVDCYICLYSDCPASQRALVRELFGELVLPVKGKLPIALDSSFPYGYGQDLY